MCNPKLEVIQSQTRVNEGAVVPEKKCSGKCKDCRDKKKKESLLVKTIGVLAMFMFTTPLFAQEATQSQPSFWNNPLNHPMMPLYAISAFLVFVIILIVIVTVYLTRVINLLAVEAEKERAKKLGKVYVPRPTWWSKFVTQANNAVPVEEEASIEMDHSYDGIKELDNHLPPWWKWLFYGTIAWSVVYLFVYHVYGNQPLQQQEYENELASAEEQIAKFKASQPQAVIDENTLVYANDAAILSNGKTVFTTNCVACHRADGGGNAIGPNLTDAYWLHKGDIKSIFSTIKVGVVEKGMPAWGKSVSPKDVRDVAFYVMSLQGTNPANAKAAQGDLFKQEVAAADSTVVGATN